VGIGEMPIPTLAGLEIVRQPTPLPLADIEFLILFKRLFLHSGLIYSSSPRLRKV